MMPFLRSAPLRPRPWILAFSIAGISCAAVRGGEPRPPTKVGDPVLDNESSSAEEEEEATKGPLPRLLLATGEAVGMPSPDSTDPLASFDIPTGTDEDGDEDEDAGQFLIAPIPFHNPTVGYGLTLGAAYMFKLDEESPSSVFGGGGFYSENGSFGGALGFKGYLDEDRYRLAAALAATRLNFNYAAGGGEIPLRENVIGGGLEFLVRSFERVYLGPQLIIAGIDTDLEREEDAGIIPDDQLQTTNVGIGLRAQRDTRDSVYYPREGSEADLQLRIFDQALGSPFDYQVVPIAYNQFLSPGKRDVIALRGSARFAFGTVPFYGESFYGTSSDLRGYEVGRYHDETLLAAQAEYRRELFWRLGAVAFAGIGTVAPGLDELDHAEALPSVGFGLRCTLEKENHVNLRIDFAWGKDQSAVYLGVGEAF